MPIGRGLFFLEYCFSAALELQREVLYYDMHSNYYGNLTGNELPVLEVTLFSAQFWAFLKLLS